MKEQPNSNIIFAKKICIDIDNVIAETDTMMRSLILKRTGGRVDLKYEDIIEFDYRKCHDSEGNRITGEEWEQVHNEFSEEKNILQLTPYIGAQDYLRVLVDYGFQLHFATSRLHQAWIPTIKWLDKYRFPPHRLHFVNHREKHLALGVFSAMIEDDLQQARDFAQQGTPAYLIAHPWNVTANTDCIFRARDWKEVSEQLQNKYR
ncbi:MAG: hypothetical protein ABSA64_11095 [Sedimentisphaerales bacterium]|jgi:uncharacterized HAD superfamily protein